MTSFAQRTAELKEMEEECQQGGLDFSDFKPGQKGAPGRMYVNFKSGKDMKVQTPRGFVVWDVGETETACNLRFTQAPGESADEREYRIQFVATMRAMQNAILEYVETNSESVWGKALTKDQVRDRFKPFFKPLDDEQDFGPTIRVRFGVSPEAGFGFAVYNEDKQRVVYNEKNSDRTKLFAKGEWMTSIIRPGGVWAMSATNQFGFTWRIDCLLTYERKNSFPFTVNKTDADYEPAPHMLDE